MRIIISAPVEKPNVFQISKVETAPLFGLKRLTFAQDKFDPYTDGRDNIEYTTLPSMESNGILLHTKIHLDLFPVGILLNDSTAHNE